MFKLFILFFSLIVTVNFSFKALAQEQYTYIKTGHLYDSKSNKLLKNKTIITKGRKILSIVNSDSVPNDSVIIDLTDYTVLPGLIDAHTHVLFSQEANEDFSECNVHNIAMEGDALRVLRGLKRAESYLYNGFTSIRDLGNSGLFLDVALRDAILEGSVQGPRIIASGPILAASGGQMNGLLHTQRDLVNQEYRIVKNPDDAKNAVREHVNQNVDLIKICADNLPNRTYLTINEMKSIVETAHSYNLKVTAHCVSNTSAWNAISAGVDGIEHGFNLEDSTLLRMANEQIYLVPTENSRDYMKIYAELAGYKAKEAEWIDTYMEVMQERLAYAIKIGIPIVAGSDNYTRINVSRGKSSLDMFKYYYEAGMKPLNILQSSTYLSALYLGLENKIGCVAPELNADIIAVKGDLLNDFVSTINSVVFVMKDGEIFRHVSDCQDSNSHY